MIDRAVIVVLDSFGVGQTPDAIEYGDVGKDTLGGIYRNTNLNIPNMKRLGLYNIDGISISDKENESDIIGVYGKAAEKSKGKNSPVGHWEMTGYIKNPGFRLFPNGFPEECLKELKEKANLKGILSNENGSGTELLKKYGEEHIKTGFPIIYTSADSVFQIAAHEDIIPVKELYHICKIARDILDKPEYNVGTVIARPFIGTDSSNFKRTYNRKDFESKTFGRTILDVLEENKKDVIAIGKIEDLYTGRGITESIHTEGNLDGILKTIDNIKKDSKGIIFTNLVDYDMLYGHRNDVEGYSKALEEFDRYLPEIIENLKPNDMLIITADHGCDPSDIDTNHTREYVPILMFGSQLKKSVNIGIRKTFADIGATILDVLDLPRLENGESFKQKII